MGCPRLRQTFASVGCVWISHSSRLTRWSRPGSVTLFLSQSKTRLAAATDSCVLAVAQIMAWTAIAIAQWMHDQVQRADAHLSGWPMKH